MSDATIAKTILDEAGEAVLRHRHVDTRSCMDRIVLEVMKPSCPVCQADARDLAAAVLRVVEQRVLATAAAVDSGEVVPRRVADPATPNGRAFLRGYAQALDDVAASLGAELADSEGSVEADLPDPELGSDAAYWKAQTTHARAERDALALRLLQMATGWERLGPSLSTGAVVEAVRRTVETRTGGFRG